MVVKEGSNVTLKCAATGLPVPTIQWRREGGEPISVAGGHEGQYILACAAEYCNRIGCGIFIRVGKETIYIYYI